MGPVHSPLAASLPILLGLLVTGLAVSAVSGSVQAERLSGQSSLINDFVHQLMACRRIQGLVLTVVQGRETLLNRPYGWADVAERRAMTPHSRFCIASCTKAFSAVLLGQLLHDKKFTWDTPINDILTEERRCEFADDYVTRHMTSRDLLSHRVGVRYAYDVIWLSGSVNRTSMLRRTRHMQTGNMFRAKARYNNILYSLAGHLSEHLGEDTWEGLLVKHILSPLGMRNTTFFHNREAPEQFSKSYTALSPTALDDSIFQGIEAIASSISICTTSTDISLWMKALLTGVKPGKGEVREGKGEVREGKGWAGNLSGWNDVILETMKAQVLSGSMFKVRIPPSKVSYVVYGYGLGWFVGYYRGLRMVFHYGSLNSYTLLTLVPDLDLAVFSHFNGGVQTDPYTLNVLLHTLLLDLALGVPPWLNAAEACDFDQSQQSQESQDSQESETFLEPPQPQQTRSSAKSEEFSHSSTTTLLPGEFSTRATFQQRSSNPAGFPSQNFSASSEEVTPYINLSRSSASESQPSLYDRQQSALFNLSSVYEGRYSHPVLGSINVTRYNDGRLYLQYGHIVCELSDVDNQADGVVNALPLDATWRLMLGPVTVTFSGIQREGTEIRKYQRLDFPLMEIGDPRAMFTRSNHGGWAESDGGWVGSEGVRSWEGRGTRWIARMMLTMTVSVANMVRQRMG